MNTQDEKQETMQNAAYNPFPEPQTIPSGWDLSGLDSTTHSDSEKAQDESVAG
jgi:hypothetical protein